MLNVFSYRGTLSVAFPNDSTVNQSFSFFLQPTEWIFVVVACSGDVKHLRNAALRCSLSSPKYTRGNFRIFHVPMLAESRVSTCRLPRLDESNASDLAFKPRFMMQYSNSGMRYAIKRMIYSQYDDKRLALLHKISAYNSSLYKGSDLLKFMSLAGGGLRIHGRDVGSTCTFSFVRNHSPQYLRAAEPAKNCQTRIALALQQ